MTYKEKLRELFKEVPEIKKDLEELKMGTKVKFKNINGNIEKYNKDTIYTICGLKDDLIFTDKGTWNIKYIGDIIGNPLEERHLRMYFFEKDLFTSTTADGFIYETGNKGEIKDMISKLDNTKSFNNQNKEVYEEIFNYLTK